MPILILVKPRHLEPQMFEMENTSGVWECHPDLETEWMEFIAESKRSSNFNDLTADLWMNFWRSGISMKGSQNDKKNVKNKASQGSAEGSHASLPQNPTASASEGMELEMQAQEVVLTESQVKQVKSLAADLMDILEMECQSIPEELREEIRSLSYPGMSSLLLELQSGLSDQSTLNFCSLLCDDHDVKSWLNVAPVFECLFLSKLRQGGMKSLSGELQNGLNQMTEKFPSQCVSSFIMPLLAFELKTPLHLELIAGLTSLLPERDFTLLFRSFVSRCVAPMQEWEVEVLNCILSGGRAHTFDSKLESPLLDLLPLLSSSARSLSKSESFATLLLKIIPAMKRNPHTRSISELSVIVQLISSFNKQALLDALAS